ncbi:MAG: SulP family inorganic anion transporter [Caldilineaceae bacterium]
MQETSHLEHWSARPLPFGLMSPKQLVANVLAGLIVSLVAIIFNISYAALVFSGPLASYFPYGISATLISLSLSALVVSTLSSLPILCAGPDSLTATVTALIMGNIAQTLVATGATSAIFPTVLIAFVIATSTTGIVLWVAGRIRLGKWVRYIPHSVIGGFLAGTGWLITRGAIKVMSDIPVEFSQLTHLIQPEALLRWLPGVLFGLAVLLINRRYKHYLVIPALFAVGVGLFYLLLWIAGVDLPRAAALGLVFEQFSDTAYAPPLTAPILAQVQWSVLVPQGSTLLALFLITIIDLLLVASGLELALETNVDFNRELRSTGAANLVAGPLGGFVACLSTSRTLLSHKIGATSRLAGFMVVLAGALMFVYGGGLVAYIPKAVLGGLLFYLGLSLLIQWLYETWAKLRKADYLLIWLILIVMGQAGLLPGIAVGLVIAMIIFTVTYSRTPILKHSLIGVDYPSNRMRTMQQRRYLNQHGEQLRILWLQGYLFFGTAIQLLEQVAQIMDESEQPLRFLILDFQHVSGVDVSALTSFTKLRRLVDERGLQLLYTGLTPTLLTRFAKEKIITPNDQDQTVFTDLDRGIEWCEDRLLEPSRLNRRRFLPLALQLGDLFPETEQITTFMSYLALQEVEDGETLIALGAKTTTIYVVEHGQVTIYTQLKKEQQRRIATLGAGAIFGDWSVPKNGFVIVEQASRLYALTEEAHQQMERDAPMLAAIFFRFIAKVTGEHLLLMNNTIDRLLS